MKFELEPSPRNNIIRDILSFAWIPLLKSSDPSEYEDMAVQASVRQVIGLTLFSAVSILVALKVTIGDNPYIDLSRDLYHFPFNLVFVFLAFVTSLMSIFVQFLCFRIVSGKGNLVAQGYLTAIAAANITLLFWLAIALLYLTQLEEVGTVVMGGGGIYLLVPSLMSLKGLHKISYAETFVGFVLSIIASMPVVLLYLLLFEHFRETHPYQFYHWLTIFLLNTLLFVGLFIVAYSLWQRELEGEYTEGVPVQEPLERMLKVKWIQWPLGLMVIFSVLLFLIEIGLPDITTDIPSQRSSYIIPTIFIVCFVLFYIVWEQKLFKARPNNVSLRDN